MENINPIVVQVEIDIAERMDRLSDEERIGWMRHLVEGCRSKEARQRMLEMAASL